MSEDASSVRREPLRTRYFRAFRPLSWWLLISAVLLAYDYHRINSPRTTLNFSVLVEGRPASGLFQASVGTQPVLPGSVVPIGWRTLRVSMPDAFPVEKTLFVWYGLNSAGSFDLKWQRGTLDLKIDPPAKEVRVVGSHGGYKLERSAGRQMSLPIGAYRVTALYDYHSEQWDTLVTVDATNSLVIKPPLGAVHLFSPRASTEFNISGGQVTSGGTMPVTITALPEGTYELRAWRDDYVKSKKFTIRKWQTNDVSIDFEYGEVKFTTGPAGADIMADRTVLGKTPQTIGELKPGHYQFRLEKEGYVPVSVTAEITGTNSILVSTNLVSVRYRDAMTFARRESSNRSYDKALAKVEEALQSKPDDADALALKTELTATLKTQDEQAARQKAQAEQEARYRAAQQSFDQVVAGMPHQELFDTHRYIFNAPLDKVREAVPRALAKCGVVWAVDRQDALATNTVLFQARPKGLIKVGRHCVVQACEVQAGEVHVHAKFWDYDLGRNGVITLFPSPDNLTPINRKFFPPDQAAAVDARRKAIAADFETHLTNELR